MMWLFFLFYIVEYYLDCIDRSIFNAACLRRSEIYALHPVDRWNRALVGAHGAAAPVVPVPPVEGGVSGPASESDPPANPGPRVDQMASSGIWEKYNAGVNVPGSVFF